MKILYGASLIEHPGHSDQSVHGHRTSQIVVSQAGKYGGTATITRPGFGNSKMFGLPGKKAQRNTDRVARLLKAAPQKYYGGQKTMKSGGTLTWIGRRSSL